MQVKEIHPRLSAEERDREISHITDELLRIAAASGERWEGHDGDILQAVCGQEGQYQH